MIKRFSSLFLILAGCWLAGCENLTQSAPEPFTTATTWVYTGVTFDSTGATIGNLSDTVFIKDSGISDSKKHLTFSDDTFGTLTPDGSSWTLTELNPIGATCSLFQILPHKGDTVSMIPNIPVKVDGKPDLGTVTVLINDVDNTITVPAGIFSCFIVEMDILISSKIEIKSLIYVSPSVGVVQREIYVTDTKTGSLYLQSRSQLTSLK